MKDYQKDILEQMVEKLMKLNELHKLKEQAKVDLQVRATMAKIQEVTLVVPWQDTEDL